MGVAGGCYVLGHPPRPLTWTEASEACLELGAHLASLNSPREFRDVADFMVRGFSVPLEFFIGLRSASSSLPTM